MSKHYLKSCPKCKKDSLEGYSMHGTTKIFCRNSKCKFISKTYNSKNEALKDWENIHAKN